MPPVKWSGYSVLVDEIFQQAKTNNPRVWIDRKKLFIECDPIWRCLSEDEKNNYKIIAKDLNQRVARFGPRYETRGERRAKNLNFRDNYALKAFAQDRIRLIRIGCMITGREIENHEIFRIINLEWEFDLNWEWRSFYYTKKANRCLKRTKHHRDWFPLNKLPPELVMKIISELDIHSARMLACTSKNMFDLCHHVYGDKIIEGRWFIKTK